MNLILLFPTDFTEPGTVCLTGRRLTHVLEIIKPLPGQPLTVGVAGSDAPEADARYPAAGALGTGIVREINDKRLVLDVVFNGPSPAKLPVVLCLGLTRPLVFKRVLQTATALGVARIAVFHSRQVEKSFWQSTALRDEEVREQLALGLEQSRDAVFPQVSFHKRFKPFVEDVLPGFLTDAAGIAADPSGVAWDRNMFLTSVPRQENRVLIIGPEGGFIPYEIEHFRKAGCRIVSLGPRILKVETAIVALVSRATEFTAA